MLTFNFPEGEKENQKMFDDELLAVLNKRINKEGKIETEEELRAAQMRQKIDHRDKRLGAELERLKNQNEELITDRDLKKKVAKYVFAILGFETLFLCLVLLLQGFSWEGFLIDSITLNIFVPATILQISSMAVIITKYLFTHKSR